MRLSYLPEKITVKGRTLNVVIGLTSIGKRALIMETRRKRKFYRNVTVYSKNVQGKPDLHNRPYPEFVWLFVEA